MRRRSSSTFRQDLVDAARNRVAEGFYDDPKRIDRITVSITERLLHDLDSVPVGRGKEYCEAVRTGLLHACKGAVAPELTRLDFPNRGARGDLDIPLRLERLDEFPLLALWAHRYGMQSVLAEVKNERKPAAVEDAKQLVGDLAVARRGKVGLLIARNGFTRPARRYMSELARLGEYLVLPCDHEMLKALVRLRSNSIVAMMGTLRSIQSELLQAG